MDRKLEDFVNLLHRPGSGAAAPAPRAATLARRRVAPPPPRRRRPTLLLPTLAWPSLRLPRLALPELALPAELRFWVNLGCAAAALTVVAAAAWFALPNHPPAPAAVVQAAAPVEVPVTRLQLPIPAPAPEPEEQSEMTAPDPDGDATEPAQALPPPPVPARRETRVAALPPPKAAPARPGEPAWLRFAVPVAAAAEERPHIAIVLDDLGLDKKRTERAIALKGPLTLSFMAYATDLPRMTEEAHRNGHELMVHVPMEPMSHSEDMGPNGLVVGLGRDEILRRLRWDLERFDGYVGINNHMGSRFTSSAASLQPVIEELKARGLLFLDSRTIGNSAGLELAHKLGVPSAARDVFLDNEISAGPIAERLAEVEEIARRHGAVIAIGHPHDATLDQLTAWIASLPAKGFALVPVSAIVKEHMAASGSGGAG